MNRRSFLQSMTAAFAMATTGLAIRNPKPIRYELFTMPYASRYDLKTPFSIGGNVYASDSRVLIAHAGDIGDTDQKRRVPDLSHLKWGEFESGGFRSLGAPNLVRGPHASAGCPECYGLGRVGDGVTQCPCLVIGDDGRCIRCEDSEWIGGRACSVCERGEITDGSVEGVGCGRFSPAYMSRLRTLGELDVKVITDKDANGDLANILLFRGEHGVRGMLMSLAE